MAGYVSKTLSKNGDIIYIINMKCIDCGYLRPGLVKWSEVWYHPVMSGYVR